MVLTFLNPVEILKQLNLTKEMTAADLGCGSGGWVIPLAQILSEGIVYAVDIQESALSALSSKAAIANLQNIKKILANIEKNTLPLGENLCDLVLMTNLLFQLEDKKSAFAQAHRILKPGAMLLVVDWQESAKMGPPAQHRVSDSVAQKMAEQNGFALQKKLDAGAYHYALLFYKT